MSTLADTQNLALSGGAGCLVPGVRHGYLPIPLAHVLPESLDGIPVFLDVHPGEGDSPGSRDPVFYKSFTAEDRQRLLESGKPCVYIPIEHHSRFYRQVESQVGALVEDGATATSEKASVLYETSVALVNEVLSQTDLTAYSSRLENLTRATTTLVMQNENAFAHLFEVSNHDFYTATHMVNVATWMVPLAYALGHQDEEELNTICRAGLLHDMGKVQIPDHLLNKKGPLSAEEWDVIRQHPEIGHQRLSAHEDVNSVVLRVTREHHERLDGSGYPAGLKEGQIHPVSKICAVVDSFDAMTAFRPYKQVTMSVAQALEALGSETPSKYDGEVVQTWFRLISTTEDPGVLPEAPAAGPDQHADNRRKHERRGFHCGAWAQTLENSHGFWRAGQRFGIVTHNLSRSGMAFLCKWLIPPGQFLRVLMSTPRAQWFLDGQVVWSRWYPDGWYGVGMRFIPAPMSSQLAPRA